MKKKFSIFRLWTTIEMREVQPQLKIPAHRQFLDHIGNFLTIAQEAKSPSLLLVEKTKIRVQGNPRSYNSHSSVPKRKLHICKDLQKHAYISAQFYDRT